MLRRGFPFVISAPMRWGMDCRRPMLSDSAQGLARGLSKACSVIPAKAGIQLLLESLKNWIPAFAGMTMRASGGNGFWPGDEVVPG